MSPIEIDAWAHELATRTAGDTGWRASDVYRFVVENLSNGATKRTIRTSIELLVEFRRDGESFDEVRLRVARIADDVHAGGER